MVQQNQQSSGQVQQFPVALKLAFMAGLVQELEKLKEVEAAISMTSPDDIAKRLMLEASREESLRLLEASHMYGIYTTIEA